MDGIFPKLDEPEKFFFIDHAKEIFLESEMMPNCKDCLARISTAFDIKFVTAQLNANRRYTEQWLNNHGLDIYPVEFVDAQADKGLVKGDILLDDGIHNLDAFSTTGRLAVCFNRLYNMSWKGLRVFTWMNFEIFMFYHPEVQKAVALN